MRFLSMCTRGGLLVFVALLLIARPQYEHRTEGIGGDDFRIGRTQFSTSENVTVNENLRAGGTVCINILYATAFHNFHNARFFGGDNWGEVAYKFVLDPIKVILSSNHYQGTLTRSLQKMYPKFSFASERRTTSIFTTSDPGISGFMSCIRFDFDYSYRSGDAIRRGLTIPAGMSVDWLSIERELFPNSYSSQILLPSNGNYLGFSCEAVRFNGKAFNNPVVFYTLFPVDVWFHKRDYFDVAWVESITSDSFYVCVESPPIFQSREEPPFKLNFLAFDNATATPEMKSNGLQFGSQLMRWNYGSNVKIVCVDTPFPTPYAYTPYIFANVNTRSKNISEIGRVNEALIGWIHFVSSTGFRYCVSESFFADRNLLSDFSPSFDWMATLHDSFNTLSVQRQRLGIDLVFRPWFSLFRTTLFFTVLDNIKTIQHVLANDFINDLLASKNNINGTSFTIAPGRMRHILTLFGGGLFPFVSFRLDERTLQTANEMTALDVMTMIAGRFNNFQKADFLFGNSNLTAAEVKLGSLIDPTGRFRPYINMEYGRGCVASPFGGPSSCSVSKCGGEGGTIQLTRSIVSQSQGIAHQNCPQADVFVICNREPCISKSTWTTWSLEGPVATFSISSPGGIGIIVGSIVVVIVIASFAYYIIRQRRKRGQIVGQSIGKAIISA